MQTHTDLSSFTILYQDEWMVAIHKPAGLLVHRTALDRHETQFAMQMTRDLIGQVVYTLHRLDKATSGILLFALSPTIAQQLGLQFSQHDLQKTYHAIVRGWPTTHGSINTPLKVHYDKIADKDARLDKADQEALTHFSCLQKTSISQQIGQYPTARYSLLELNPTTGRKHQLRRHLNYISHPIIGDVSHGDRHHNHFFNDWLGQHRLYLAATQLSFIHPVSQQTVALHCPPEPSFQIALDALGFTHHFNAH
ncbi:pseudouridine synthase [Thiomicrorhabdus aquaedulcis]|uniref:pseudouridine synthase n=1 Tax=Thiomicrorhabdus aquaedulcis TaxID=2211106 RepID=UPI000FDA4721|nr:pseudouridine synthase [Thiomicrorhabdus aquaedulcis]